jgi:hypothetical protein
MVYQRYTPPTFIPLTAALIHHRVEGGPRCRRFLKTEREFQPRYGVGKAVKEDIPLAPVPWPFPESIAGLKEDGTLEFRRAWPAIAAVVAWKIGKRK